MNEEKEQLSPVSILECPFKDDEDDDDEDDEITDQNGNFINMYQIVIYYKKNVNL